MVTILTRLMLVTTLISRISLTTQTARCQYCQLLRLHWHSFLLRKLDLLSTLTTKQLMEIFVTQVSFQDARLQIWLITNGSVAQFFTIHCLEWMWIQSTQATRYYTMNGRFCCIHQKPFTILHVQDMIPRLKSQFMIATSHLIPLVFTTQRFSKMFG